MTTEAGGGTADLVEAFRRDGFVAVRGAVAPEVVRAGWSSARRPRSLSPRKR
jgi:hypothetical protein